MKKVSITKVGTTKTGKTFLIVTEEVNGFDVSFICFVNKSNKTKFVMDTVIEVPEVALKTMS